MQWELWPIVNIVKSQCYSHWFLLFTRMCHDIIEHSFNENIELKLLSVLHTPRFSHSSVKWNTLRIFYTPHFPHSAFSTLRIFHTPHFLHSALSTLGIFYTPHSAYSTEPILWGVLPVQWDNYKKRLKINYPLTDQVKAYVTVTIQSSYQLQSDLKCCSWWKIFFARSQFCRSRNKVSKEIFARI